MTDPARAAAERRVLILAPSGRDAALAHDVFARAGVAAHVCSDLDEVCAELDAGAGALLIAEEAAAADRAGRLTAWLARQPPWSDLPVLLLARPGADSPAVNRAVELLGNVAVLDRPARIAALVSAARTALRGRERQYQARQLLLDREQTATELRTLMDLLPVGVFVAHDPAGRRITGNRAANAILRMPAASNLSKTAPPGQQPTHFRPSRDGVEIPPAELPVQRAARGEVVPNEEVDQVFDDGTVVHTLISAAPLFDAAGTPRGAVASVTDITPLKRAERGLLEAQRVARVGSWEWDAATGRTVASDELYRIYGLPLGEPIPAYRAQRGTLYTPENWDRLDAVVQEAVRTGVGYTLDVEAVRGGEPFWVTTRAEVVRDAAGRVVGLRGTVQDITDRKRAEERSARLAEELRLVTDAAPSLISYIDAGCRYRFVNKAYEDWFGRPREEVLGRHMREVLGEAAFERLRPHVQAALAGHRHHAELEVPYKDGGTRYVLAEYVPDVRPGGGVPGYYAMVTDISDRKRAEEAVRASEARFRTFADTAPAMLWVTEADGSCSFLSRGWYEFTGQAEDTGLGFGWLDAVHPEDRAGARDAFLAANAARAPFATEHRLRRAGGGYAWVIDAGRPRTGPGGEVLGYIGSVIDITDRKRAEQQLRRSHDTFFNLIENAPFGVYVVDADFRLRQVSAGAQAVFANVRPLAGRDFAEVLRVIWAEPFASEAEARFRHTLATGEPYAAPDTTERRGDVPVVESYDWMIERATLPDGTFGVVCYFYDITDRKEAEAALRSSESRARFLNAVGEATRDAADPTAVMAAAARVLGEHLGVTRCAYADVDADGDRFTIRDDWRLPGVATTAGVYSLDLFGTRAAADMRAGRVLVIRDVDAELTPADGADTFNAIGIKAIVTCPLVKEGRLRAMMAVHNAAPRDWAAAEVALVREAAERAWAHIERVRAAADLRQNEERFRTLVEQVEDYAIFTTDPEGRPTSWNVGVRRVLGFEEAEFLGADVVPVIFTPEDVASGEAQAEFDEAAATGRSGNDRWMRRRDGTRFFALGVTTGLHDAAGRLLGFLKVMRDQTDRKRMEDDLRRAVADLSEADKRKNEFLAMLAHELRNPLAPIRNSLHILKLVGAGGSEVAGVHDMMERQVNHMVRLVDDLLEVSRITRGKIDLRRAPVALADVFRTAVETSRPLIDAAGHALTVDVPAGPLVVDGDAVRLAQVFANLLNNAAKYTDPGGAIHLRARRDGADAVVTVRDTGAGIPAEMLARVFELFTQIDRSDARAQGGLGIGLTLVKSLVELHGGRVAVRSDGAGKGSEFEVRLPLAGG